ncbi:MAG: efflux RND transporter periplasmic adaptor subunit, partial [Planctomycetota bacterium]
IATGEIKPVKEVELKSKASGQVVRFQKEPGEPVEAGELIAELDKRTEQRNLSLAESNLMSAEANLIRVRLQVEADLKTAESEAAAAREDEAQKKADLARLERLAGDLVTEAELGAARLAARLAEEKAKQAEATLAFIRGRKDGDVKLAEAEVLRARVAVEDARERLRDTEIRSPIRGILLKKLVEEGQIVASGISASTGGTPMAVVADVSRLYVEANVDETDVLKVRRGQPAEVSLASGSIERFRGRVDLIPPKGELDSNVTVFKVRVAIEEDAFGRAYVGMSASVRIRAAERKNTLWVPSEAVRLEDDRAVVQVAGPNGPTPVAVRVGLDNGIQAEILEGLAEAQEIWVTRTSPPGDPRGGGGRYRLRF